jgi:hypothetical protein
MRAGRARQERAREQYFTGRDMITTEQRPKRAILRCRTTWTGGEESPCPDHAAVPARTTLLIDL